MTRWVAALLLMSNMILGSVFLPRSGLYSSQRTSLQDQASAGVQDLGTSYQFGSQVSFNARIQNQDEVDKVLLFLTPSGQPTILENVQIDSNQEIHATFPASSLKFRPFSKVTFHYQLSLHNGQTLNSPDFSFNYEDNRFQWQSLEENDFIIAWYGRDTKFGQDVMNIARDGLKRSRSILPVDPPAPVRIYVYTSLRDLQSAWPSNNQPWVAGYAEPDLNQVLISIPTGPDQDLELERQVPHEILHVLQFKIIGDQMEQEPVWLIEGMASLAELYPNPDYQRVLTVSVSNHALLPMLSLCDAFPRDASGAYKAYAESESFVRFLYQTYGSGGLQKLMSQYSNGLGCEEGASAAFGVSLDQLEYRWKQESLGIDVAGLVMSNLSPYLLLLALLLIPAAFIFLPITLFRKPAQLSKP